MSRNQVARIHLEAKKPIQKLQEWMKEEPKIYVNKDSYILAKENKILGYHNGSSLTELIRLFTSDQVNPMVIIPLNELDIWEEEGFIIDKSKYHFINEDQDIIRLPMKYLDTDKDKNISNNHRFLKQVKPKDEYQSSNLEHKEINRLIPGLAGVNKNKIHEAYDRVRKMIPNNQINPDTISKALSNLHK